MYKHALSFLPTSKKEKQITSPIPTLPFLITTGEVPKGCQIFDGHISIKDRDEREHKAEYKVFAANKKSAFKKISGLARGCHYYANFYGIEKFKEEIEKRKAIELQRHVDITTNEPRGELYCESLPQIPLATYEELKETFLTSKNLKKLPYTINHQGRIVYRKKAKKKEEGVIQQPAKKNKAKNKPQKTNSRTRSKASLVGKNITGKIKFFDVKKSFGFLLSSKAEEGDIFFHGKDVRGFLPDENEIVSFDLKRGSKGLFATNIKR